MPGNLAREPRLGGKSSLRIVVQESRDILLSLLESGTGCLATRGQIADLLKERHSDVLQLELVRAPSVRSDFLLAYLHRDEASSVHLDGLEALLRADADIIVLSVLPDVLGTLPGQVTNGCGIESFEDGGDNRSAAPLAATLAKDHLTRLIRLLKATSGAHVILYNCSPLDPADHVHNYHDVEDTLAVRVRRFNLIAMELSATEGISIIDVERIVAQLGEGHVQAPFLYSDDVYESIRQEFGRVLEDIGFFERRPLVMQLGRPDS